jgi:predicted ATPase
MKVNVAVGGGPCTGKSTLAAALFADLKEKGYDWDLITEESRTFKHEMGRCRSPFERLYFWRQQERQELRSSAANGFITDSPLYHQYVMARRYAQEPRDQLAVRELFRWCTEIQGANRYQLFVMAEDPREIAFKRDSVRSTDEANAHKRHVLTRSFVEHFSPEILFFVKGPVQERVAAVYQKLKEMGAFTD